MRTTVLACVVMAGLAIGAQAAYAGITCSFIPGMCPADKDSPKQDRDWDRGDRGDRDQKPTSVPEPGTLMLLAAGVSAVGGAAWRRKRAKKD